MCSNIRLEVQHLLINTIALLVDHSLSREKVSFKVSDRAFRILEGLPPSSILALTSKYVEKGH